MILILLEWVDRLIFNNSGMEGGVFTWCVSRGCAGSDPGGLEVLREVHRGVDARLGDVLHVH